MDSELFRLPTKPNLYAGAIGAKPVNVDARYSQVPTPNARFPGWAAPMDDARATTDYRPHCSMNVPAGSQFITKAWVQHNSEKLIDVSRYRFAELTGAVYGLDPTVIPPAASYVSCTESECTRTNVVNPMAIGVERLGADAPPLFGTFQIQSKTAAPKPNVGLTSSYEGGRNSLRGSSRVAYLE
jgi:hypothetical protein